MKYTRPFFRGVQGVNLIYHGDWKDPELRITRGCFTWTVNYWTIEDTLYDMCRDEYGESRAEKDEFFNEFCRRNAAYIKDLIKQCGKCEFDEFSKIFKRVGA